MALGLVIETAEEIVDAVVERGVDRLDLRSVPFIDPYALLLLSLALRERQTAGRCPLTVLWPETLAVRRWMTAMRFFDDLRERGPAREPLRSPSSALQPIVEIGDEAGVGRIVEGFERRLNDRYPLGPPARRRLVGVMFELFQNVPQHANATGELPSSYGVAAMQDYAESLVLAIADNGIGLGRSLALRSDPSPMDDEAAMRAAVLDGLSRFADPGRGHELQKIVGTVRSWEGTIVVRSGRALLYQSDREGDLYRVPPFPGVQIALRIPRRVFGIDEVAPEPETVFNEFDE